MPEQAAQKIAQVEPSVEAIGEGAEVMLSVLAELEAPADVGKSQLAAKVADRVNLSEVGDKLGRTLILAPCCTSI